MNPAPPPPSPGADGPIIQALPVRPKLSGEVRVAAWVALIVSALVGLGATQEAAALMHLEEAREANVTGMDPRMVPLFQLVAKAQVQALRPQRTQRMFVLFPLSIVCGLGFVAAARLLRPGPLPRDGMRRMAGGAVLIAGVLRTLDGAFDTAVMQHVGEVLAKTPEVFAAAATGSSDAATEAMMRDSLPGLTMAWAIVRTILFAGSLVALGQYLRSERARKLVERAEAAHPV